ncbi:hypothetical protein NQ176_g6525 [Zarea fungicola]|uniref:Uncharacterized protein n=1 Tax=Zarea fungicola TaxID=93591 RepID=A0ACC1N547_9HYPO|nr:hypothetical protein NQ176_g6525 [Lecanicillium fungicola]
MSSEEEAIETVAAARATAGVIHEQARLSRLLREHGDPYNWPIWRKVSIALIASVGQLVTLMSTTHRTDPRRHVPSGGTRAFSCHRDLYPLYTPSARPNCRRRYGAAPAMAVAVLDPIDIDAAVVATGVLIVSETYMPHTGVLFYFDLRNRLGASLLRQPVLIVYQPAIQVIAVILALNSAVYYPRLSTYASLWIEHYDQSETVISLNYIALAVGVIKASQAGGPLMNFIYARMKLRHGDAAVLEFQKKLHWMVVDVGTATLVCASFILSQGMLAYLLDSVRMQLPPMPHPAWFRTFSALSFPSLHPPCTTQWGTGGPTLSLGFIWVVLGFQIPILLWLMVLTYERWGEVINWTL